ncbi:hypothetical protein [uncultured Arthrobacter sp.]|uniref:hypothetical protein n=1 Tax=uncultured Arthrobacter sp. TaxID=114050 RepID=UPI0028D10B92|nr:hypothetical protein [uncultured Arthrobacter sp.]
MSHFSISKSGPKVLCLTAALVLGTGAVTAVYASTTSAAGEISGCFNNNNGGQLRILSAGSTCDTKKETPISWNSQGIQGVQGIQGIAGIQGIQGDKGDTGSQGIQGETGATGAQGETGDVGPQGIQGETGAPGAQGEKGDTGETGATGAPGAQGEKGDTGETGATGAQGEKGDIGETGATGAQGGKGDTGATGAAASTSVTVQSLTASTGTVTVLCDTGQVAMGGGFSGVVTNPSNQVTASQPVTVGAQKGWSVTQTRAASITVYATCID